MTAALFLVGFAVFFLADLAVSFGAIYALGFQDPAPGLRLHTVLLNTSYWASTWDAMSICLGITATTLIFKMFYEKLKYRRREGIDPVMGVLWLLVLLLSLFAIGILAILRAEYLVASGQHVEKVNTTLATWGTVISAILFIAIGAICLSEGLQALSDFFRLRRTRESDTRTEDDQQRLLGAGLPASLLHRLDRCGEDVRILEERHGRLRDQAWGDEAKIELLENRIAILGAEILNADHQWADREKADGHLYQLGMEHGRNARRTEGAYSILKDRLQSQLADR